MNRKNLTAAVLAGLAGAAGIAGSAQAVNVNPDGLGQVLLYPYYTSNNGNSTIISVVNTTDQAKAVKVRFLEGQNSREVLDFNLYLSPWDVWVGAVADGGDLGVAEQAGVPHLVVADSSCTVPYLYETASTAPGVQEFLTLALSDGGSMDIARTSEGHVEVIEMGDLLYITPGENYGTGGGVAGVGEAVTHVPTALVDENGDPVVDENGDPVTAPRPADCGLLTELWTDNTNPGAAGQWIIDWRNSANFGATGDERFGYTDITTGSGGLFGGGAIVDIANGTMYSYDAKALNGFFENGTDGTPADYAALHARPGLETPNLNSGNVFNGFAFTDNGQVLDSGAFTDSVDAVSYVFMHDQIMNEYTTEDSVGAETEWVITFPTKARYVNEPDLFDAAYNDVPGNTAIFDPPWAGDNDLETPVEPRNPAYRPFVSLWDGSGACEPVSLDTVWDREETPIIGPDEPEGEPIPPVVSPSIPEEFTGQPTLPFSLCYESTIIRFGGYEGDSDDPPAEYAGPTEILGSSNVVNFNNDLAGFESGWARINLFEYRVDDNSTALPGQPDGVITETDTLRTRFPLGTANGNDLVGLPVVGFAVQRFVNSFLDGGSTLANYGGIFSHKGTRLTSPAAGCAADSTLTGDNYPGTDGCGGPQVEEE